MLHTKIMNVLSLALILICFGCTRAMVSESSSLGTKSVTELKIFPSESTVEIGEQVEVSAVVTYSDNTTEDVTDQTTWNSMLPTILSLSVSPNNSIILGVSTGIGMISANFQGLSSNAMVTVTNASLVGIEVTPVDHTMAVGVSRNFMATGIFSDATRANITNQVTWSSSDDSIATVSNDQNAKGSVSGKGVGNATITASYNSITESADITIDPSFILSIALTPLNSTVAKSSVVQYMATAQYSGGALVDISSIVNWTSSNTSVASVSNMLGSSGKATALNAGQTTIRASLLGFFAETTLNVNAATLSSIDISPLSSSAPAGSHAQFNVSGTYSDGSVQDLTEQASWSSSHPLTFSVSNVNGSKGHGVALLAGNATVSASIGGFTASTGFTVSSATLVSIAVNPASISLSIGLGQPLQALGTFSDLSVRDITNEVVWSVANPALATVSNAFGSIGQLVPKALGVTNIIASSGIVTGATVLTGTNATLLSISLAPASVGTALGQIQKLVATGLYSDGSTADITNLVTWATTTPTLVNPSNALGFNGFIYSLAQGVANVTASLGVVSQNTSVTVSSPDLLSITVTPNTGAIIVLGNKQFKAMGLYTDGVSRDITTLVTWTENSLIGSINSNGLFTGINVGPISVTATLGVISKTSTVTLSLF